MVNKELVKFRFKKSIKTYDDSAVIQKEMACYLTEQILSYCGNSFDRIFEFGTGTGFLSKNIANTIKFSEFYANDITEESESCIKNIIRSVNFIAGDIEKINIDKKFNLVVSNAVMQWICGIDELLLKINSSLEDDGYFAFTTFGEQNFKEIKETTGVSLNYLKSETIKEKCSLMFEILCFEEHTKTLCFDSPLDVLRHIKYSGTNGIKSLNWTTSKLKHFETYYKKCFGINNKVTLTYNPVYMILKAKQH